MATVKSYLNKLSKPQLEALVLELAHRNEQVQEFLEARQDTAAAKRIFDRYWDALEECFPPLPEELRLAEARQLLVDYAKVGNDGELAMQLMGYAALGAQYTHNFGDMDEDFYGEFEESFEAALALAMKHNMVAEFRVPADEVLRLSDGVGYGYADAIREIHAAYFGKSPAAPKGEKRAGRKVKGVVPEKGKVVAMNAGPAGSNPFGAKAPEEVLCIESRPMPTVKDGTVWLYLAMDAHTRFAFHQDLQRESTLPNYVSFVMAVLKKHPELAQATLAVDTPEAMGAAFRKVFPKFRSVLCDAQKVHAVTEEFHTAFLAQMGGRSREN